MDGPDKTANSKAGNHDEGFRVVWGDDSGLGEGWYFTKHPRNFQHVKGPYFTSDEAYQCALSELV